MEVKFENIESAIIKEISKANKWIKVNVPWFTSLALLHALSEAQLRGVHVELIIENDAINSKLKEGFNHLEAHNAGIFYNNNQEKLNHEKFAVIDGEVLIYGSYNWTNKANMYNNESIFILKNDNDSSVLNTYLARFEILKKSVTTSTESSFRFDTQKSYFSKINYESENFGIPNLIPFHHKGKWGYCGNDNRIVIQPIYKEARPFSEGLACVKNNSGQWGFINIKGEPIIDFQFSEYGNFFCGLTSIAKIKEYEGCQRSHFGAIDKKGNIIIPFNYAYLGNLSEGMMGFSSPKNIFYRSHGLEIPKGVMNYKGEILTNRTFDYFQPFSEGMAVVARKDHANGTTWFEYNFINTRGNFLNKSIYSNADRFSNGVALIKNPIRTYEKYGFIDKQGNLLQDHLKEAETFYIRTSYIKTRAKTVIVDTDFQDIIDCKISKSYTISSNFYNGVATYTDGKKYGYIKKSGEILTDCVYKHAKRHRFGVAIARRNGQNEYVNIMGETIYTQSNQFEDLKEFNNNLGIIKRRDAASQPENCLSYITSEGMVYGHERPFI